MEQNLQCPVCSTLFNELASALPYSHSSQSYLICRISGEPMNEHNLPMSLPNGYVYGEQVMFISTRGPFTLKDVINVFLYLFVHPIIFVHVKFLSLFS